MAHGDLRYLSKTQDVDQFLDLSPTFALSPLYHLIYRKIAQSQFGVRISAIGVPVSSPPTIYSAVFILQAKTVFCHYHTSSPLPVETIISHSCNFSEGNTGDEGGFHTIVFRLTKRKLAHSDRCVVAEIAAASTITTYGFEYNGGYMTTNEIQYSYFPLLILVLAHGCSSLNPEGLALLDFKEYLMIHMDSLQLGMWMTMIHAHGPMFSVSLAMCILCGSEKLSDEAIEDTLEKLLKLLAYISDKVLFSEFYSLEKEINFADLVSKSAQYCFTNKKNPVGQGLMKANSSGVRRGKEKLKLKEIRCYKCKCCILHFNC
ncbi:unnamed protein product [Lactuca saligna]|uniref:Uncharacterized protein n=1 Tax=Lactuca saligna TaxID=75948 RepID=A0AA36A1D4_LACSI|nr:unnamed protein product [Lactuca saligna]